MKLTKQNLDQQFKTNQFDLPDIETESVMIQEDSAKKEDERTSQMKMRRKNSESKNSKQHLKTLGEHMLNNTATIMSKSLTHSQMGGQESETIRRV